MTLELVDKRDLSPAEHLTAAEQDAIRAVAGGVGGEESEALVLEVMNRAREHRLWVGCDCRREDGRRPVVAPCRNDPGTHYWWRVLAGRHLRHDESCVFHRTHIRLRDKALWDRPPRKAPEGFFAVLRDRAGDQRVSKPGGRRDGEAERTSVRRPAMSQHLLMLMDKTGLNRIRAAEESRAPCLWLDTMGVQAAEIQIAPGRLLSDLWFSHVRMWNGRWVHARVRETGRNWPARHKPQGFLCWVVWDVDAHGVGSRERNDRVDVRMRPGRPVVGRNRVPGPYLFLGAVGLPEGESGYECLEAYAQPIVASDWPVPVDSHYERQAFGTLRTTLRVMSREFPDAEFELEKPVFDIETPDGQCLPDFLI